MEKCLWPQSPPVGGARAGAGGGEAAATDRSDPRGTRGAGSRVRGDAVRKRNSKKQVAGVEGQSRGALFPEKTFGGIAPLVLPGSLFFRIWENQSCSAIPC